MRLKRPDILGLHSDNGSEFINGPVVRLLNKLLIQEHTKSRSRHCNNNAQAESKNGAIVRKHLGYGHIPQRFVALVNALFGLEYTWRVSVSPILVMT